MKKRVTDVETKCVYSQKNKRTTIGEENEVFFNKLLTIIHKIVRKKIPQGIITLGCVNKDGKEN